MDTPKIATEAISEPSVEKPVGVEATAVAETVPVTPASPQAAVVTDDVTPQPVVQSPAAEATVPKEEVSDLVSADVQPADNDWTAKVRDVIKEDEGQPAKEETDAEALNEEYMKARFNVDVDATPEEK
jgi:hypothetical protein